MTSIIFKASERTSVKYSSRKELRDIERHISRTIYRTVKNNKYLVFIQQEEKFANENLQK